MFMRYVTAAGLGVALALVVAEARAQNGDCDKACLEALIADYQEAYLAHDPSRLPLADDLRYTENNVEMPFPDGTWDTVTEVLGPPVVLSDPKTGNAAFFTPIKQDDVEGYLGVRFLVEEGEISEIEHIISTKRTLSSPPTPIAPVAEWEVDPIIDETVPEDERVSRDRLAFHAHGYFNTLQKNDGEIRDTCFHDEAIRRENGLLFTDIKGGFESGRYLFNERVRREVILIDEERQISLARGFIDHKGVLDDYKLTDGSDAYSIFQEPQSWAFLEMFKVTDDCIASVVANFYQSSYYQRSPWTEGSDR